MRTSWKQINASMDNMMQAYIYSEMSIIFKLWPQEWCPTINHP